MLADSPAGGPGRLPVVIDTDPGIDDALALLLAWGSPELRVEAITTVAGNVTLAAATTNVLRLLDLRRPEPRPRVAAGAAQPLARPLRMATRYHGRDGLGDLADWPAVDAGAVAADGVDRLVDCARCFGPALTVVALGPLTNVALAVARAPAALAAVGRVVAMGGAVDVPGNVTPEVEFNMHVDPDAARQVFEAGLAIDLVPLDATRQAVLARGELEAALARRPGPVAARIAAVTVPAFRRDHERGSPGMHLHDPLAVALALDPTLAGWEPARLAIEPDGQTRRAAGAPNCRVARAVDRQRFMALFLERLCVPATREA